MAAITKSKAFYSDYLGEVPYERSLELQQRLIQARVDGTIPDVLLLLQHPLVFTIGRFRGEDDLLASPAVLEREGITVFHSNRGGSITHHGPGQLVGYPLLDLRENGLGVRDYIWKLEEVIINLLRTLSIAGYRSAEHAGGVWVAGKKVCSIGIHVNRHVTMHGFALNVSNDLRYFQYINPCGLSSDLMTSINELSGRHYEVESIAGDLPPVFAGVFGLNWRRGNHLWLLTTEDRNG